MCYCVVDDVVFVQPMIETNPGQQDGWIDTFRTQDAQLVNESRNPRNNLLHRYHQSSLTNDDDGTQDNRLNQADDYYEDDDDNVQPPSKASGWQ